MSKEREKLNQDLFDNMATFRRLAACFMQHEDGQSYLPPSQGELLLIVYAQGPLPLKALAHQMQLSPGAITQLVEALEQTGYVKRIPSPDDRRVTHVEMTGAGHHKILTFKRHRGDMLKRLTSVLEDDELSSMIALQNKMIAYLREQCPNRQYEPAKERPNGTETTH